MVGSSDFDLPCAALDGGSRVWVRFQIPLSLFGLFFSFLVKENQLNRRGAPHLGGGVEKPHTTTNRIAAVFQRARS